MLQRDPLERPVRNHRHAHSFSRLDDCAALAPARQGKLEGDDPRVLATQSVHVRLDPTPEHSGASDEVRRRRRCRPGTRVVVGVDATGAVLGRHLCVASVAPGGDASVRPWGSVVHRGGLAIDDAPLAKADDRDDQIGRASASALGRVHGVGAGSVRPGDGSVRSGVGEGSIAGGAG